MGIVRICGDIINKDIMDVVCRDGELYLFDKTGSLYQDAIKIPHGISLHSATVQTIQSNMGVRMSSSHVGQIAAKYIYTTASS